MECYTRVVIAIAGALHGILNSPGKCVANMIGAGKFHTPKESFVAQYSFINQHCLCIMIIVGPVYYGHLGTSQVSRLSRCPDFLGQFT